MGQDPIPGKGTTLMNKDFYSTLGLPKTATQDEVKAAYRKLALKYHPDRNPGNKEAENQFKDAAQAYETLSDPEKRRRYDSVGHSNYQNMGQGMGGPAHDMDMDDILSQFGDIFGAMFGQQQGRRQQSRKNKSAPSAKRGNDLYKEITITLAESFVGLSKELSYHRFVSCDTCVGRGTKAGTSFETCKPCKGAGQVTYQQGFFMFAQTCGNCSGEGFSIPSPCPTCKGQSRVQKLDRFTIQIPKGIANDEQLRIADKGDSGMFEGKAGSLYIKILVQPDKNFRRVGDNLECNVLLTYPQLVLGCQVEVISIDGSKETIKIPKGCPVGERITIAGKGFSDVRGKAQGSWVIVTKCYVPKKISNDARDLLTKYDTEVGQATDKNEGGIIGFFKKFLG
jgi:molecular chaperone DnaJ